MAKPTVNTDWNVADNSNRIEPSSGVKNTGIQDGDTWGREWLNWQFYGLNQWINWVRDDAVDRQQNLADLTNAATARTNIDVFSKDESKAASAIISGQDNSAFYQSVTLGASGDFTSGSCKVVRIGDVVTVTGDFPTVQTGISGLVNTSVDYLPTWAVPTNSPSSLYNREESAVNAVYVVRIAGPSRQIQIETYTSNTGTPFRPDDTGAFTITYAV